jgi:hypothetical protein
MADLLVLRRVYVPTSALMISFVFIGFASGIVFALETALLSDEIASKVRIAVICMLSWGLAVPFQRGTVPSICTAKLCLYALENTGFRKRPMF